MTDPTEVVRSHLAAFNARNVDALLAGFSADAVWTTGATTVRGRDDLAVFFRAALTALAPTLTVRTLIADGDRVACELVEELTVRGIPRSIPIAGFYRVTAGRISAARIYRAGSAEL